MEHTAVGPDERGPFPRVFGSEIEYGLHLESGLDILTISSIYHEVSLDDVEKTHLEDNRDVVRRMYETPFYRLWQEEKDSIFSHLGVREAEIPGEYLTNGARAYIDIYALLEYATPECLTPEDVVTYQLAGDEFVSRSFRYLRDEGKIDLLHVNKRSSDKENNTWGHHENIHSRLEEFKTDHIALLGAFLVAKSVLVGSGGYIRGESGDYEFVTSPRVRLSEIYESSDRFHVKPLVHTAFSSDTIGHRIQLVSNEASNYPWAIRLSHAMNSLAFRLMEHEVNIEPLIMDDAADIEYAKTVTQDIELRGIYDTYWGKRITQLDWLEKFCSTIRDAFPEEGFLTRDEIWAMEQIQEVVDDLRKDPLNGANRIEWMARKLLFEKKQEHQGRPFRQSELIELDYYWDSLDRGFARPRVLNGKIGWHGFERALDKAQIDEAVVTPPNNTRAKLRARAIDNPLIEVASWDTMFIESEQDSKAKKVQLYPNQIRHRSI